MTVPAVRLPSEAGAKEQPRSIAAGGALPVTALSALVTGVLFWGATGLYLIVFCAISLRQYDAYLPHALDLGNMAQAAWNTIHGHPFRYYNQRLRINFEAFGTITRLSAHVEPIFPFIGVVYAFWQHVQTLLMLQTVAVASGAIPVRLLARRRLGHRLAEVAFPVAYLLFPALEAANLDEFHPVVLAAPLLLWAFYFADGRRYTLFALTALAAVGCKEEIGLLVGLMGLWIAIRNGDRRFGAIQGLLCASWSVLATKGIVPHFSGGESSYWARYLPTGYAQAHQLSFPSQGDVLRYWLHYPGQVLRDLADEARRSYLHRLLFPVGYLALLSPLTLLIALPSLVLVLFSYEPHMYGGLAHYSAELVPVVVVSSIFGVEWLCRVVAPRLRIPYGLAVATCCVYVLAAGLVNHRFNGFSPLAESFSYPAVTAHDRELDRVLAMIPPDASVSAQDALNAHLSDRGYVFLYPDLDKNRVQYIALDATQGTGSPIRPCDLYIQVVGEPFPAPAPTLPCDVAVSTAAAPSPSTPEARMRLNRQALLNTGRWEVAYAHDGILLLHRRTGRDHRKRTLPPGFYSFITPTTDAPPHRLVARFGDYYELEGYAIDRREGTNLRNPDVVITTWWRMLKRPPQTVALMHYLSDSTGALQYYSSDQQATDWLPMNLWQPGQTYRVTSSQLTVKTNASGHIDVDIGITTNPGLYLMLNYDLKVRLLQAGPNTHLVGPCSCQLLKLDHVDVHL